MTASVAELQQGFLAQTEERLAELQPYVDEHRQLTDLHGRLKSGVPAASRTRTPSTPRAPRATTSSNGGNGGNGQKVDRMAQFLKIIGDQPGVRIPEIAEQMKIEPNYLYRLSQKATAAATVRKEGQQLFLNV